MEPTSVRSSKRAELVDGVLLGERGDVVEAFGGEGAAHLGHFQANGGVGLFDSGEQRVLGVDEQVFIAFGLEIGEVVGRVGRDAFDDDAGVGGDGFFVVDVLCSRSDPTFVVVFFVHEQLVAFPLFARFGVALPDPLLLDVALELGDQDGLSRELYLVELLLAFEAERDDAFFHCGFNY